MEKTSSCFRYDQLPNRVKHDRVCAGPPGRYPRIAHLALDSTRGWMWV